MVKACPFGQGEIARQPTVLASSSMRWSQPGLPEIELLFRHGRTNASAWKPTKVLYSGVSPTLSVMRGRRPHRKRYSSKSYRGAYHPLALAAREEVGVHEDALAKA